jgi:pimeloyl-ACP methyl ester carboxylesterase
MFARFEDAMLQAHCHATLKPKPEGGFTLCCPPAVEATIFASHHEADYWALLPRIKVALDLVGGDPATPDNDWISGALPDMAALIPRARFTRLSGTGHMLISEQPERCAALVLERIGVM